MVLQSAIPTPSPRDNGDFQTVSVVVKQARSGFKWLT